jgi:hypothetical protein
MLTKFIMLNMRCTSIRAEEAREVMKALGWKIEKALAGS